MEESKALRAKQNKPLLTEKKGDLGERAIPTPGGVWFQPTSFFLPSLLAAQPTNQPLCTEPGRQGHEHKKKLLAAVGFEPTPPKRLVP